MSAGPAGPRPVRATRRRTLGAPAAMLLLFLLVLSVAGVLPVQLTHVGSESMAPTLADGDLVALSRWHGAVDRADVVVVESPTSAGAVLVKRVAGLAGDTVAIEDGVLVVNGRPVCEPWSEPAQLDGVWHAPVVVPDNAVYLLGDARGRSVDSRAFGPVAGDAVVGVVLARVWPHPGAVPTAVC